MSYDAFLALDIGSVKIAAVIGKNTEDEEKPVQILGQGLSKSDGLKKGIITNIQEASNSVQKAVSEASRMAGIKIDKATVSISSAYAKGVTSHGIVNIIDGEISINEIKRSITTALYNAEVGLKEYENIHILPYMFKVDEHEGIEDPIGMNGSRLEAFVYIVSVQKAALNNLKKVIKNSGIGVKNFVLDGYATSLSTVNNDEKNLGVATINMGGSICNLTVSKGNTICYSGVIPVGSNNITNDISAIAQTDIQSAEETKLQHASLLFDKTNSQSIELPDLGDRAKKHSFSLDVINQIVYARVEETLMLLKKLLNKSGYKDEIGAGIILTGGTAKIKGIQELASKIFDGHPTRIAKPSKNFSDALQDQSLSTVAGLILYASGKFTKYEIDSNKNLRHLKKGTASNKVDLKNIANISKNDDEESTHSQSLKLSDDTAPKSDLRLEDNSGSNSPWDKVWNFLSFKNWF